MPTLAYKARSSKGKNVAGRIDAASAAEAVKKLRQSGIYVVSIEPSKQSTTETAAVPFKRRRVKQRDILWMLNQLELMIRSGMGLDDVLTVAAQTTANPTLRDTLTDVRDRVKDGASFSQALSAHTNVFEPIVVRMIAAAESSGTLAKMLESIRQMLERRADLRRSIRTALAYPAVLLTVALAALCVLFIWVLPKFAQVFAEVGAELPAITKAVLAFSHFISDYKWFLLAFAALAVFAARAAWRNDPIKAAVLKTILKLPLFGTLIKNANTAAAMHMMSTLWRAGLAVTEVTRLAATTMRNPLYRDFFEQMRQRLIDGKRIIKSFESTDIFPRVVAPLIRTGEETGCTPTVLEELAAHHQKETQALIKTMMTLVEPIIIVMMAGGVGIIAISVVVPLFRLSSAVH